MSAPAITMDVRRVGEKTAVVDIRGEVTAACEPVLMSAYEAAGGGATSRLVLNFGGLEYMNSGGIGMLVTLLVRANRQHQQLAAYGLSEHYREIFELTRLDEAITIYDSEESALNGVVSGAPPVNETNGAPGPDRGVGRADPGWRARPPHPAAGGGQASTQGRGQLGQEDRPPRGRPAGRRPRHQRRRATADRAGPGVRQDVAEDLPDERRAGHYAGAGHRHLARALPRVLAEGQPVRRRAHRDQSRRRGPARPGHRRRRQAVHRSLRAVRRRRVVHADDSAGPHVRRLDHLLGRGPATPTVQARC